MIPKELKDWWQRMTTSPCDNCGEAIPISDYAPTGNSKKGTTWWSGESIELECPDCGAGFWLKK